MIVQVHEVERYTREHVRLMGLDMSRYTVRDLVQEHGEALELEVIVGGEALERPISIAEVQRAGLSLAGYLKEHEKRRILICGVVEVAYLKDLPIEACLERLKGVCFEERPALILSRGQEPCDAVIEMCASIGMPVLRSPHGTSVLRRKLEGALRTIFAPSTTRHGTLVEVFGVGILIEGESGVGKSEAALGLLARGHRLVSDDVVKISMVDDSLRGEGEALIRHQMEIRGIGIIDVSQLFGALCVRQKKRVDLITHLKAWDDNHFYDRVGLDEARCAILDHSIPYHTLPVKPGRDVVLLLETIALRHRLKVMGRCPAKALDARLSKAIAERSHAQVD